MWLVCLHVVFAVAVVAACRSWRAWKPNDQLQRMDEGQDSDDEQDDPATSAFPPRPVRAPKPPFSHAHSRIGLVVHLLCLAAATFACLRLADTATLELQSQGLLKVAPVTSVVTSAPVPSTTETAARHLRDSKQRRPAYRGPSREEIMSFMKLDAMDDDDDEFIQKTVSAAHARRSPQRQSSALAGGQIKAHSSTAAPAIVFHLLSLPLALAHVILYSPWSWLDPRSASSTPITHFLRPRVQSLFQAASGTAYLMQLTLVIAMVCMASTDLDGGRDASTEHDFNPSGMLTGLIYFPYFLLHTHRFALNAIFLWRWRRIFPQVAVSAERVRQQQEKERRKKQRRKIQSGGSVTTAVEATTTPSNALRSRASRAAASRRRSESESSPDEDDSLDMSFLRELASFARPDGLAAGDTVADSQRDPNADPMEPSPMMQRLRNTPKLAELLREEERQRKAKRKKKE